MFKPSDPCWNPSIRIKRTVYNPFDVSFVRNFGSIKLLLTAIVQVRDIVYLLLY